MDEVSFRVGGEALAGSLWSPPVRRRSRGGLVLAHGLNGSRLEFGDAPGRLAEAGFHVLAFDQRGFGRSGGERGRTDVGRGVADLAAAAGEMRRHLGKRAPLGVVGHSLGGSYAVAAMARTDLFRAGAVAHPVPRLFDELNAVERALYHVLGRRGERREARGEPAGTVPYKVKPRHLFVDRGAAARARADGLVDPRLNLGNYRAALEMDAEAWARGVRVPVLCVLGPRDRAASPERSRRVYEALPEPKALVEHRGGHSCFRDLDAALVTGALVAWFTNHLE